MNNESGIAGKIAGEFVDDYRKWSNEHGLGTSGICQYNTYPNDPCKEASVEFPKIAGLITPMCRIHYKKYMELEDALVYALNRFSNGGGK